jgi:hypothetical protein
MEADPARGPGPIFDGFGRSMMQVFLRRGLVGAATLAGLLALAGPASAPRAEDLIEMTLTFQGAVHGEIAPCG